MARVFKTRFQIEDGVANVELRRIRRDRASYFGDWAGPEDHSVSGFKGADSDICNKISINEKFCKNRSTAMKKNKISRWFNLRVFLATFLSVFEKFNK